MSNQAVELYKQALLHAYSISEPNPANPFTHDFQSIVAATYSELIIRECMEIKDAIELTGVHSAEYKRGVTAGLGLYESRIKEHFGIS
jgi:hypothetical protein